MLLPSSGGTLRHSFFTHRIGNELVPASGASKEYRPTLSYGGSTSASYADTHRRHDRLTHPRVPSPTPPTSDTNTKAGHNELTGSIPTLKHKGGSRQNRNDGLNVGAILCLTSPVPLSNCINIYQ